MKMSKKGNTAILGVIIFILIIIIAVILAWSLGYIHFGKKVENNDKITTENVNNPSSEDKTQESVENGKDVLKEAYKKYDFEWISKKKNVNTYVESLTVKVEIDEKIYDVSFNHGEPLYSCPLPGHDFHGLTVVTKNGEAYIGKFENGNFDSMTYTKVNISEKIVDVCFAGDDAAVPYSGPYYMTETGKVLDRNGNNYEEINRNHIASVGTAISTVYICEDNTIDIPLDYEKSTSYTKVVDSNKNNIKAKYVFYDSQADIFYIVADNNKLYKIDNMTTGMSSIVNDKEVSSVSYTEKLKHMLIHYGDSTKVIYDEIYSPYDLENGRYMQ